MSNDTPTADAPAPVPDFVEAPAPFSGAEYTDPLADIILRSSDGIDFHVHQYILQFGSPDLFGTMFKLPNAGDHIRDGKVVVHIELSSKVLYKLLSLAYPAEKTDPFTTESLNGFVEVYYAADKYQFLRVQRLLRAMLEDPVIVDPQPYRVFAIARACGEFDIARNAGFYILRSPLPTSSPLDFPEMKLLTWEDGSKIHKFYDLYWQSARRVLECQAHSHYYNMDDEDRPRMPLMEDPTAYRRIFVWWNTGAPGHNQECAPGTKGLNSKFDTEGLGDFWRLETPTLWFRNHIAYLAGQMPFNDICDRLAYPNLRASDQRLFNGCQRCSQWGKKDLSTFAHRLEGEMRAERDRICESLSQ